MVDTDFDASFQIANLIRNFDNYYYTDLQHVPTGDADFNKYSFMEMTTLSDTSENSNFSEPENTLFADLSPIKPELCVPSNIDTNNNYNFGYPYQQFNDDDDKSVVLDAEDWQEFLTNVPSADDTGYHNTSYTVEDYIKQEVQDEIDGIKLPSFSKLISSIQPKHSRNPYCPYSSDGHDDLSDDDENSNVVCKKGKRGAKNILLWKFLLEQLEKGQGLVRWVDMRDGKFRFVDTIEISRLWGEKKRKNDMNFEKMSRAIRHYYKSGFMSRIDGVRLVYRINWTMVPKEWRRKFARH